MVSDGVKVDCFTNLDLAHCEEWPELLPCRPVVGDMIESLHRWQRGHIDTRLGLRVIAVTFRPEPASLRVELHVPAWFVTVGEFYDWYEGLTGRRFR